MSDSFGQMIRSLRDEVFSERNAPSFVDAQHRHEALERHSTIASVLGVLDDERPAAYAEKEALSRALIAELQARKTSFWSAVLLLAYYPMLSRLRHRIYGDSIPRCDLDQFVIATFLSVVADFPLDEKQDRVAMHLRQRTQRRVFRCLREDQRRQDAVLLAVPEDLERVEATDWPATTPNGERGPQNPKDAASVVSLLVEHGGDILDGECFDLVTATSICGRRISEYLERGAPELARDDRPREYQRIKRRHSRAVARLRPLFEHLRCPHGDADLLCPCRQESEPKEASRS
jgi:hypothetical protein